MLGERRRDINSNNASGKLPRDRPSGLLIREEDLHMREGGAIGRVRHMTLALKVDGYPISQPSQLFTPVEGRFLPFHWLVIADHEYQGAASSAEDAGFGISLGCLGATVGV